MVTLFLSLHVGDPMSNDPDTLNPLAEIEMGASPMMSDAPTGTVIVPNTHAGFIEHDDTSTLLPAGMTTLAPLAGTAPPHVAGLCQSLRPAWR